MVLPLRTQELEGATWPYPTQGGQEMQSYQGRKYLVNSGSDHPKISALSGAQTTGRRQTQPAGPQHLLEVGVWPLRCKLPASAP